ncbi:MAG: amidohydrolase family protein [Deltaproteobacteria bacterium]|nr:amidohydrolase family protein [Deltaproteobacteria bacterium]
MSERRPVIISCDGHATGRPQDYVPYVDPAYREKYEEFVRGFRAQQAKQADAKKEGTSLFTDEGSFAFNEERGDARDGEWNSTIRTQVLEGEGIVAEVLFPNGGVPFGGFGESAEHELRGVGNRAYDRWLADFADDLPGRRAALAMLTVHDLEATCHEIRWAAERGMKGVIIPTVPGKGLPPYYDECYDPLWAACQDTELPVHIHGGGGTPDYGDYGVVSMLMYATEATFFSQRNLWVLIWGGCWSAFRACKWSSPRRVRIGCQAHSHCSTASATPPSSRTSRTPRVSSRASISNGNAMLRRASWGPTRPRSVTRSDSTASCGAPTIRTSRGRGHAR